MKRCRWELMFYFRCCQFQVKQAQVSSSCSRLEPEDGRSTTGLYLGGRQTPAAVKKKMMKRRRRWLRWSAASPACWGQSGAGSCLGTGAPLSGGRRWGRFHTQRDAGEEESRRMMTYFPFKAS